MRVTPIKTQIVQAGDSLEQFLQRNLTSVPERSVLAVTSKVVALCQNRVEPIKVGNRAHKQQLAKREAEYYLDETHSKYDLVVTLKDGVMAVNGGLDESNAAGQYVLLPEDSFQAAAEIWQFLRDEYGVKEVGVVITDSKTIPLKWGVVGTALGHCGFQPLNNHIGDEDLFGHKMIMTQVGVAEGLAATAVLNMGEVAESTPLCLIEDASMVKFMNRPLTLAEINDLRIEIEDDVYGPVLSRAPWKKN